MVLNLFSWWAAWAVPRPSTGWIQLMVHMGHGAVMAGPHLALQREAGVILASTWPCKGEGGGMIRGGKGYGLASSSSRNGGRGCDLASTSCVRLRVWKLAIGKGGCIYCLWCQISQSIETSDLHYVKNSYVSCILLEYSQPAEDFYRHHYG